MMIGHLPAGYLASKLLAGRLGLAGPNAKRFIGTGLAGALAPDLDLFYFYFVDHRQHFHHSYWSHFPILWIGFLLAALLWRMVKGGGAHAALLAVFALNGLLHMVLDTFVADILWLAPFSHKAFALFTVPALYQPWWLNFVLHWVLLFEIALWVGAIRLWRLSQERAMHG